MPKIKRAKSGSQTQIQSLPDYNPTIIFFGLAFYNIDQKFREI